MAVSLEGLSPQAIADLAVTLKTLTDNPQTRSQTLALMKHADPSLNIPEIDIPGRIAPILKAGQERIERLERSLLEKEARERVLDARSSIVRSGIVSESEIPEVEKLMLEKGISSHETAAQFFASQKQAAQPTPGMFGQKPVLNKPDFKAMGNNVADWARNEATATITELMKGRRAA